MADLATIERALRNADKAGDVEAATRLAAEYKRVRDAGTVDANSKLSALTQAASTASQHDRDTRVRAELEATKLNQMRPAGAWRDFNDAAKMDGLPFADELFAATLGNVGRMARDRVGPGEAYTREMALSEALAERRRERSPKASLAGAIAGGVGTGLTAAGGGLTLAGKALPVLGKAGTAALEGGAYGALYGAGEGRGTDRLKNAAINATAGAVTAGLLSKGGDMLAARAARKAVPAAPTAAELKAEADLLFNAARQSGSRVTEAEGDRLIANMTLAAGKTRTTLQPQTEAYMELLAAEKGKGFDIELLHNIRQDLGKALKKAAPPDTRTLMRMKSVLDGFIDNAPESAVQGGRDGLTFLRQGINTSARQHKAATIEMLIRKAKRDATGTFTQSGLQNALKNQFKNLDNAIEAGRVKGFTASEIAMIKSLASRDASPAALNWLAKFSPRGVMSMIGGGYIGNLLAGPAGVAVPAAGWLAGTAVDRAAIAAANTLRDSAARGGPAILPKITNKLTPYAVPGAIGAMQIQRELSR